MAGENNEVKDITIGEMIKHIRITTGLSQKELGEKLALADTSISAYERSETNISLLTFLKLAELCDFDVNVTVIDKESTETFNLIINKMKRR